MAAGRADFRCTQGQPFTGTIVVKNPDLESASLRYWDVSMHIRRTYSSADPLIILTTANGRIGKDNGSGTITLSLSASETGSLELGDHVYDLEVYATANRPSTLRLVQGIFTVE